MSGAAGFLSGVVIAGAIVGGAYLALRNPEAEPRLEAEKQALAAKVEAAEETLAQGGTAGTAASTPLGKLEALRRVVPDEPTLAPLQSHLALVARDDGLMLLKFSPKAEVPKAGYREIPLELQAEGPYDGLVPFLDALQTSPRLLKLGDVHVERRPGGSYRATIAASTFYWPAT